MSASKRFEPFRFLSKAPPNSFSCLAVGLVTGICHSRPSLGQQQQSRIWQWSRKEKRNRARKRAIEAPFENPGRENFLTLHQGGKHVGAALLAFRTRQKPPRETKWPWVWSPTPGLVTHGISDRTTSFWLCTFATGIGIQTGLGHSHLPPQETNYLRKRVSNEWLHCLTPIK